MHRLYKNSLNGKITFSYGAVFFFLFIILSVLYYFTSYHNFLITHKNTSKQLSKIISSQLDTYVDNADAIEKRILESDEILNYIFNEAAEYDVKKDWAFRNNLYSIFGYSYNFYHMNIVNLSNQTLLTFGEEYDYKPFVCTSEMKKNIIAPSLTLDGSLNIIPPEDGCLYAPRQDVPVFTITRSFGRYPLTTKNALIEIQLSVDSLSRLIENILYDYNNGGESVLIFDNSNSPIYTAHLSDEQIPYYLDLYTDQSKKGNFSFMNKNELITIYSSSKTDLSVMLITPQSYLLQNRLFYMTVCIIFFICSFIIMTIVTRKLSQKITAPITELSKRLSTFELNELDQHDSLTSESTYFNEMDLLSKSYDTMQLRLKKSLDDAIHSRTLTIHSQMMALQAQMDSHFLYNTLTIISIIAEDNNDEQASAMCIKLTKMLRYITEDISQKTTFAQEVAHTKNYTDLISIRFQDNVCFHYQVSDRMDALYVPRLIIQPLVENSIKYSRKSNQILDISIRTWTEDSYWYATIQDNGDGFSEEAMNLLWARIHHLNSTSDNPMLNINGMGLANIYLRLKLYYNENFIFKIENIRDGNLISGSSITIGGKTNEP